MTFTEAARPYVVKNIHKAQKSFANNNHKTGIKALENAHVIGQYSMYYHTLVHFEMLKYGIKQHDYKEVMGQILRLIGALTKTSLGWLPAGNTGGANVSAFKAMPVSPENKVILKKIKNAQS